MTSVLLDTVGLIAVWDVDDQWHAAAENAYQRIITPAAKKVIYQPDAPARDPVRFPRWRVGLICSSMRNFLAGVIFPGDKGR